MTDGSALRCWIVSESKAGTIAQCRGVAEKLGAATETRLVRKPHGGKTELARRLASGWAHIRNVHLNRIRPPWPDLTISCGGRAEPVVMEASRRSGRSIFTVHLQVPADGFDRFDLCFVGRHDWRPEFDGRDDVLPMVGAPHRVDAARVADHRAAAEQRFGAPPARRAAVMIGGPNRCYTFSPERLDAIVAQLRALQAEGWSLLVTTSRRSDPAALPRLQQALHGDRGFVWDRTGENPYFQYLALADVVLVTADSITMTCEAASTGKPVFSIPLDEKPSPYLEKFRRFHRDMQETLGVTRPFTGAIEPYGYAPLDEAGRIAGIVRERLAAKRQRRGS
ncbi:mitochondrial fission ELM1 family protein [Inquilinus limosus]|uniref:mitochondrial fission ELM1 family protein n=1 Tax=Inquilinus limosus TaxID=171674 RepID=UPI003F174DB8